MNNDWIDGQRRRWMRNAAHLHVRQDVHRFAPPGSARSLRARDARWDPLGALERKYSPDQPRVPAGNPDGGQWTNTNDDDSGGSGFVDSAESIVDDLIAEARRLKLATRSNAREKCIELCSPLLERIQPPGVDFNYWDFQRCLNECLERNR